MRLRAASWSSLGGSAADYSLSFTDLELTFMFSDCWKKNVGSLMTASCARLPPTLFFFYTYSTVARIPKSSGWLDIFQVGPEGNDIALENTHTHLYKEGTILSYIVTYWIKWGLQKRFYNVCACDDVFVGSMAPTSVFFFFVSPSVFKLRPAEMQNKKPHNFLVLEDWRFTSCFSILTLSAKSPESLDSQSLSLICCPWLALLQQLYIVIYCTFISWWNVF